MRAAVPLLLLALLPPCARAFDLAAWREKREDLSHEVDRLRAAYAACAAAKPTPAEDVVLPVETFPGGAVKTAVQARRASYFMDSGLVWAEGVLVRRFRADGAVDVSIAASECVVDRQTKSVWADGGAELSQGGTVCRGRGVYFSSPEGFVRITEAADFMTTDANAAKGGASSSLLSPAATNSCLRIRSASCDVDRDAGVAMFETGVVVEHGDATLCADRVFAFSASTNGISRVVAEGGVSVTNGTRVGSCALAVYRRARGEVELFGEPGGAKARLAEAGERSNELQGDRIRIWTGSEQVEVSNSALSTEGGRSGEELRR